MNRLHKILLLLSILSVTVPLLLSAKCPAVIRDSVVSSFYFRQNDDLTLKKSTVAIPTGEITQPNRKVATKADENVCPDKITNEKPLTSDTSTMTMSGEEIQKVEQHIESVISATYKPLFALKTNLLFDVASLLNLELEIPLAKRFSLAVEATFPWWLWESKQHCLQMKNGNIEARYWFGNRSKRNVLTGWFAGLYANGGNYDLEWGQKGYLGKFFLASGISGGFVHAINKRGNLRMEYSLGLGYMKTKYRHYESVMESDSQWHLYRLNNGQFEWIGPTRAKISIVWMFGISRKGGGK